MSKKIIIAEDSSVIQNLTKRILSIQSYEIVSVKNGQEVLKKLEEDIFDLVLLDINMPVMDGVECAKRIRESSNENIKNIPIIAISGNARNYSMDDFKAMGINDYLPKPLDYDQMVEKVHQYTNN
ncbi:MAG: two-component system cell cycle response regulator DivK [Cyclobacteriaceae bacterium]|jgi:two-component system cell cycle response regulator DivK